MEDSQRLAAQVALRERVEGEAPPAALGTPARPAQLQFGGTPAFEAPPPPVDAMDDSAPPAALCQGKPTRLIHDEHNYGGGQSLGSRPRFLTAF